MTGFVQDLDAEYRRARVALAPLSDPSGLKIKVVQAMALGIPVVARPAAVTGIQDAPAECFGAVTNSAEDFAAAVIRLLTIPGTAEIIGQRAAAWSAERFDMDSEIDLYDTTLDKMLKILAAHPTFSSGEMPASPPQAGRAESTLHQPE
jgi:glycosyltransferase involved in cell wall biosynthesis